MCAKPVRNIISRRYKFRGFARAIKAVECGRYVPELCALPQHDRGRQCAFGLEVRGLPKAEIRERVRAALDLVLLDTVSKTIVATCLTVDGLRGGQNSERCSLTCCSSRQRALPIWVERGSERGNQLAEARRSDSLNA
jgi:hypothetical protein